MWEKPTLTEGKNGRIEKKASDTEDRRSRSVLADHTANIYDQITMEL